MGVEKCLTAGRQHFISDVHTFISPEHCFLLLPLVLSDREGSSVIRTTWLYLGQNNNIPAKRDGQLRRGCEQRHGVRTPTEGREKTNVDVSIRNLLKVMFGVAAPSTCNKTSSKHFFKASAVIALQCCSLKKQSQETLQVHPHRGLLDQRGFFVHLKIFLHTRSVTAGVGCWE